ncbi:MAG: hypothetical protein JW839_11920 [Candidatus Lokiarchaeota archaeon]|nr:hypothetical protein [Candidatus Lokiarchaeota archaeon]
MTAIEMAISCDGFPLYKREFQDIRAIDDDDVIAASLYAVFFRIRKSMADGGSGNDLVKLDMGNHYMHVMKTTFTPSNGTKERDLSMYIVEDSNLDKKASTALLRRILDAFIEQFEEKIEGVLKQPTGFREFDPVVDRILGNMSQRQYKRFFDTWDAPRMQ